MNRLSESLLAVATLCGGALLAESCSSDPAFLGAWTSVAPVDLKTDLPSVASATSVLTLDFSKDPQDDGGTLSMSNAIEIVKYVQTDSTGAPRAVEIRANADAKGTWAYDLDDDDDLIIVFDQSSLDVKVADQENYDPGTLELLKAEITRVIRSEMSRLSVVSDVEVSDNGRMMSLETHSPETEVHFKKVEI